MYTRRYVLLGALWLALSFLPVMAQDGGGILHIKSDWNASWIWRKGDNAHMWVSFRKEFELGQDPVSAIANIAVESKYWLYINGVMVVREGGLKRGPTPQDTYYDEVDIATHLKAGTNTIAIMVWYWAKSGFSHLWSGRGGLLFEASIDGQIVASDASWKERRQVAFKNSQGPIPNFRLPELNVVYDARNSSGPWMQPGYNTSGWRDAIVVGQATLPPWNRLFRRPIPQWKDSGLVSYENEGSFPAVATGDTIVAVLPYNAQVTTYLKVDARAGLTIDMRTDQYSVESVNGVRFFNTVRSEYVTVDGVQEFETPAWMNGQAVHYHIPAGVRILELKYRESGFDADFLGSFESSDPFLNKLWTKARRTIYVLMRDYFMETAGRERRQALADGTIAMLSAHYALDDRPKTLMRKFWFEFDAWRNPEGAFRTGVPGNALAESPQPNLFALGDLGLWNYYLQTGDIDVLRHVYPNVRDYLELWQIDDSGLVVHRAGEWDWFDWEHNIDEPVIENAWYYLALKGAVKMARETGNQADVARFEQRMEQIYNGYNREFWRGDHYRSKKQGGAPDDRGNALAVLAGLLPPVNNENMNRTLRREKHASPFMENFVLQALFELGDGGAAINRMRDRYFEMVDHPSSTLSEYWSPERASKEHPFPTGTLRLLTNYVAGVRPLTPRFERVRIEPQMGPVKWVDATVPTDFGLIEMSVERFEPVTDNEPELKMRTSIPEGVTAIVGVPKPLDTMSRIESGGQVVWFEGTAPETVEGLRLIQETLTHVRFEATEGDWDFVLFLKPPPAKFDEFGARLSDAEVFLKWKTFEEQDSTGFVIEERLNETFRQIGYVDGLGQSGDYEHEIREPMPGRHTYRVKAVGSDGAVAYSTEATLEIPLDADLTASPVYPNPLDHAGTIIVAVRESQPVKIDVVNALGQRVWRLFDNFLESGEQYRMRIPVLELPSGSYAVVVSGKTQLVRPFVVAR